jgi:hypothetical protein
LETGFLIQVKKDNKIFETGLKKTLDGFKQQRKVCEQVGVSGQYILCRSKVNTAEYEIVFTNLHHISSRPAAYIGNVK